MSSPPRGAALEVKGLRRSFRQGGRVLEVLRGLDMGVAPGELVSIMGQSGVGKSTLLHLLGGLDSPTAGEIIVDGEVLSAYNGAARAEFRNRQIGFVFQFHHLLREFSALENVMMPALIRRTPRRIAFQAATRILIRLGLGDRLSHKPGELSGGEQQRVALGRALVGEPALLLLDEPTGNLDGLTSRGIHGLLEKLVRELGLTCIVVTHDASLARLADRRLVMVDGRLARHAVTEDRAPDGGGGTEG